MIVRIVRIDPHLNGKQAHVPRCIGVRKLRIDTADKLASIESLTGYCVELVPAS
jgi:hypothetical protein